MNSTLLADSYFRCDIERSASVPTAPCNKQVQVLRKTRSLPTPKSPNPCKPEVFDEYFGAKVAVPGTKAVADEFIASTRRADPTKEILLSGPALFDNFYGTSVAVAVEPASLEIAPESFESKDAKQASQLLGDLAAQRNRNLE
mmetsp:Transcript_36240/g.85180  ORF Transcript_36240/g.85180 Transcript_36240/m.85180 type:complete len:143 (-) Transcript_36240:1099-1527(-)|eukprot:690437-Rhodomonas_salina.3